MRSTFLFIMFIIFIHPLLAEETDTENSPFKKYSDQLMIRITPSRPWTAIEIRPVEAGFTKSDGKIIRYSPNILASAGVSASWKGYGLSLGRDIKRSEVNSDTYGKTEYRSYQIYYNSTHYGFDFFWRDIRGFYLLLPQRFGYERGDPETRRSDLTAKTFGVNMFYAFSDDFSFSASFGQSERQLKSGGSFMTMLSYTQFSIDSDRSLIPPSQEKFYGEEAGYRGGNYRGVGILPGYGYTLVLYDHWFITGVGFFGGGWMNKKYNRDKGTIIKDEPFGRFNARVSLGKNADNLFFGASGVYDATSADRWWRRDLDKIVIRMDVIYIEFYAGMRFDII